MPSLRGVIENVFAALVVAGLAWIVSRIDASIQLWVAMVAIALVSVVAFLGWKVPAYRRGPRGLSGGSTGRSDLGFEQF